MSYIKQEESFHSENTLWSYARLGDDKWRTLTIECWTTTKNINVKSHCCCQPKNNDSTSTIQKLRSYWDTLYTFTPVIVSTRRLTSDMPGRWVVGGRGTRQQPPYDPSEFRYLCPCTYVNGRYRTSANRTRSA